MARSQETFSKKEKEKKRLKKRKDKLLKKEERKANSDGGDFESMLAYVDENGNLVDSPPDLSKKKKINAKSIEIGIPRREKADEDPELIGSIAFFNSEKGFGFINDANSQDKYFVHINNAYPEIAEGDKVNFELERGPRGLSAFNVKIAVDKPVVEAEEDATDSEEE
ncbi:cold-shock protein [Crocinitomix catalasitica]|uniref:cold-shock protein n=1 Tax=Crocinitomix catalasitica TaxID=184607 RepID=UPI000685C651|nr:cold shock domain-containing protein [Crocinitomix catalasitica]